MPIYFHSAAQKSPIQGATTLEKIVKELVAKLVLLLFFLHLLVPQEKPEDHSQHLTLSKILESIP